MQRPLACADGGAVFDRPGPSGNGKRVGKPFRRQSVKRDRLPACRKLFRALAGFALCGGIFADWLLADQPVGSVAGAFPFAVLCNQGPACFVCSLRFQHQVTDYVRTASLLLDRAQSLGFAASQFNGQLAVSADCYRDRPIRCGGSLYHTQRLAAHPLFPEGARRAGFVLSPASVLKSNMLLLLGLIFLLAGWSWYSGGAPPNGREWVFRLLAGHGTGYFYPLGFMALLLAELFPLWPLGRMLSQAASEHSVCLAVRLKRRKDMLCPLLRASGEWIACWCGLLLLAETVPALMLGFEFPVWLILEATGLRFLDMAIQALVICLFLCLSGQTIFGFLSVILLHILSLLPIPWLPVGLSSLLRLHFMETGGVIQPVWAALELGICNLILLFWLYRYGAQRLFEKSGG